MKLMAPLFFTLSLLQFACGPSLVCLNFTDSIVDSAKDTVSFITFGDWGKNSGNQREVARAMHDFCLTQDCDFVVTLGDNFYETGVSSITDTQWYDNYTCIYSSVGLPFYASLGNHDLDGNIQAQIDYSQIDETWHMPGTYYSVNFPENSEAPVIQFFIINPYDFTDTQTTWLTTALAASQANWKILVVHTPIISNGAHGDDAAQINSQLLPIICNQIDVVLAGHDHIFSHLRQTLDSCAIEQVIIGTGGGNLHLGDFSNDTRVLSTGTFFGFGWLQATSNQLDFKMITAEKSTYYSYQWTK